MRRSVAVVVLLLAFVCIWSRPNKCWMGRLNRKLEVDGLSAERQCPTLADCVVLTDREAVHVMFDCDRNSICSGADHFGNNSRPAASLQRTATDVFGVAGDEEQRIWCCSSSNGTEEEEELPCNHPFTLFSNLMNQHSQEPKWKGSSAGDGAEVRQDARQPNRSQSSWLRNKRSGDSGQRCDENSCENCTYQLNVSTSFGDGSSHFSGKCGCDRNVSNSTGHIVMQCNNCDEPDCGFGSIMTKFNQSIQNGTETYCFFSTQNSDNITLPLYCFATVYNDSSEQTSAKCFDEVRQGYGSSSCNTNEPWKSSAKAAYCCCLGILCNDDYRQAVEHSKETQTTTTTTIISTANTAENATLATYTSTKGSETATARQEQQETTVGVVVSPSACSVCDEQHFPAFTLPWLIWLIVVPLVTALLLATPCLILLILVWRSKQHLHKELQPLKEDLERAGEKLRNMRMKVKQMEEERLEGMKSAELGRLKQRLAELEMEGGGGGEPDVDATQSLNETTISTPPTTEDHTSEVKDITVYAGPAAATGASPGPAKKEEADKTTRGDQASTQIFQSLVFFLVVDVIQTLMDIPWKLYDTFVIEQRHGFNRQTLSFFVKDKVKSFVLSIAIGFPVVAVIIAIIQSGGAYFFVYLWAFLTVLIFFMMTIYPEFIAPLFDKYTPLSEGELREKIEALASKLHFPLKKLYVVEGSKRSAHSNAYLYGFGNNKRIVLYDTLIGDEAPKASAVPCGDDDVCSESAEKKESGESKKLGMSNDEVVAVLGHELGHWALSHMLWNVCITEVNLFLMLMGFAYFYSQKVVYEAFGFADCQPTVVGLLIVFQFIFAPYNEILTFLMNAWSRRKEFEADRFSAELGYAPLLSRSLIKLSKDNLAFPISDWLYSAWNFSHPPVIERIQALKKYQ